MQLHDWSTLPACLRKRQRIDNASAKDGTSMILQDYLRSTQEQRQPSSELHKKKPLQRNSSASEREETFQDSPLRMLNPFIDKHILIRVGRRIAVLDVSYDKRPIIPNRHQIATLVCHFQEISQQGHPITEGVNLCSWTLDFRCQETRKQPDLPMHYLT